MISTRSSSSLFRFALMAIATACTAVVDVGRLAFNRAVAFLRDIPAAFAREPGFKAGAIPAEKHQACAFAMNQAKRERPRSYPGQWVMCPSC